MRTQAPRREDHPGVTDPPRGGTARIGPNALIQTARALEAHCGAAEAGRLLRLGGMPELADHDPRGMQDERSFFRLVSFLEGTLGSAPVTAILHDAGRRTGAYVLANRIPGPARIALEFLPRKLRLRLTLSAVARHSWTFAGSSTFGYEIGASSVLHLVHGPGAQAVPDPTPLHAFYHGSFELLLRAMVSPRLELEEAPPRLGSPRSGVDFRIRFADGEPGAHPSASPLPSTPRRTLP